MGPLHAGAALLLCVGLLAAGAVENPTSEPLSDHGRASGACCDPYTGECSDNVLAADCLDPLQFDEGMECAELDPVCGNPGCCCWYPQGYEIEEPTQEFEANCVGRFLPGVLEPECEPYAFDPPCGQWYPVGVLYCPANPDNPTYRAELSALLDSPVDYFDPRTATPTLEELMPYACVQTWANYAYADKFAMGDVLADYVDAGGKVILGQWCLPTAGNYLSGRIMDEYCPATASSYLSDSYAGDGFMCPTIGVSDFSSSYCDQTTTHEWAFSDGTTDNGYDFISMDPTWRVWCSPGNTGADYTTGDVVQLTANLCACVSGPVYGACCDILTGECTDNVEVMDCLPREFSYGQPCAELNPPCGNPGCCCDDLQVEAWAAYEARCQYRFSAVPCAELAPPCGPYCCYENAIVMWDDYGDGWNGGYLEVYLNGSPVIFGATLESGSGPGYAYVITYPSTEAYEIETVWTPGGWPYQCSYCIYNYLDEELGCDGLDGVEPTGITVSICYVASPCGGGYCEYRGCGAENCLTCPEDCGECSCVAQAPNQISAIFSDFDCDFCGTPPAIRIMADNFVLLDERIIQAVRFWGGYYPDDIPMEPDCWTVVFRADDDGLPGAEVARLDCVPGSKEQTGAFVLGVHEWEATIDVGGLALAPGSYFVEIYNDTAGSTDSWVWEIGDLDVHYGVRGQARTSTLPESPWDYDPATDMAYELICSEALAGDLNCDGNVDFFDIDPFVLAITDPAGYEASYPDCDIMLADCNGDGVVDFFDIDAFVLLVTGG